MLCFFTNYVKNQTTSGPRASAPPRKCDPGSLFNSPIAPTATRFKPILFFSNKNSFKSFKIMNKCLGDARGIPRGIPGAAPGHPRGSPGAPGDPRSTAGAPRGKGASRDPLLGTHFPRKSSKNIMPCIKKRGPGIRQRQSAAVRGGQRQPAVPGKVVSGPRPGTTLLHAPGTKMT